MTFDDYAQLSVSDPRVLVEIDIGAFNTQWVNNGAGIWAVDAENVYSWVDSTLVEEGFSAQDFGHIGSVQRDGITLTEVYTLAALTDATDHWYYDPNDRMLYVCLTGYDEPSLHDIIIGVVYGYSYDEFTPSGSPPGPYQGRLLAVPRITISRDPLYYGVLSYGGGSIELANADGEFDTFAEDNELYGNQVRIYLGYDELDYADYERIYTGVVESFDLSYERAKFDIIDKRKQFTIPARFVVSAVRNATAIINSIVHTYYSYIPLVANDTDSEFWDYAAWLDADIACGAFQVDLTTVTIVTYEKARKPLIDWIGDLCTCGFLVFFITPTGLLSANYVDHTATTSDTVIINNDIFNDYTVLYSPTEVISSVRVGHTLRWSTTGSSYVYYRDTDREASVYTLYKTYKEHTVELPLQNTTIAALWSTEFLSRHDHVRASAEIQVPVKYYATEVGEVVFTQLNRASGEGFIGTTLTEITSKSWNLTGVPSITFGVQEL